MHGCQSENIVFPICWLNDKEECVKGFVWQKQYNQLNSPGTLELIESIKNDYLSTWHMVRENWVITAKEELVLK